jgi:hypothetical protein
MPRNPKAGLVKLVVATIVSEACTYAPELSLVVEQVIVVHSQPLKRAVPAP